MFAIHLADTSQLSLIEIFGFVFGILGTVVGIVGIVMAKNSDNRARKLAIEKTRFSWSDIELGCRKIARKIKKKNLVELIITFSGAGSIICNLSLIYSDTILPVFTIIEYPIEKCPYDSLPGFVKTQSKKWIFFIPESLAKHSNMKILIIHDCSISGAGLTAVKDYLSSSFGYSKKNITDVVLIATQSSIQGDTFGTGNYIYKVDNSTFYFPWGERR